MSQRRGEVFLHGEIVGTLREGKDGKVDFRFVDAYRRKVPRPVLGQRFEDEDLDRVWGPRTGQRLPDFFTNLVPEGRLRELIEETAGIASGDDLGLLAHVGQDLPGAVTVKLTDADGQIGLPVHSPSPDAGPAVEDAALRFSLAGVQLKFSMLREEEKLVLPMRGRSGAWIVKFPSPTFSDLPANEYAVMEWARAVGFDVPECHLHAGSDLQGFPAEFVSDGPVLAVRRYDRVGDGRVHQEDFAQAVGLAPEQKYEQVTYEAMGLLVTRFIGEEAPYEMVRRLAFLIASGNGDAHLKNWSLLYPDRIRAEWSPLYDQVATVAWPRVKSELALKLAGVRRFDQVDRAAFERLAERAGLSPDRVLEDVDATLSKARQEWERIAELLPAAHADALREHWRRVPLLDRHGELP